MSFNRLGDKLKIPVRTTVPTVLTGFTDLFTRQVAGKYQIEQANQYESETLENSFNFTNKSIWQFGSGAALTTFGGAATIVGTISHPAPTAGTFLNSTRRAVNTSAGGAGSLASLRPVVDEVYGGQVISGQNAGGWYFFTQFATTTLRVGNRFFIGMTQNSATAPTNIDPLTNTTSGKIGMAINTNTGNWNLIHNIAGTAPTQIALGASFPVSTTGFYELILYTPPNNTTTFYRVRNVETNAETSGSITTNKPALTTFLGRRAWITNNATAGAVAFAFNKITLEAN